MGRERRIGRSDEMGTATRKVKRKSKSGEKSQVNGK